MTVSQEPLEALDLSVMLRGIMTARSLTVADLAQLAGVSKSAMEKYLAGPSSPRAVAVASLARSLGISADTLLFGEIDASIELAYNLAFDAFARLLKDMKADSELAEAFASCTLGSDAFADLVRNVAFERAGSFKRAFNAARRDEHFGKLTAVML